MSEEKLKGLAGWGKYIIAAIIIGTVMFAGVAYVYHLQEPEPEIVELESDQSFADAPREMDVGSSPERAVPGLEMEDKEHTSEKRDQEKKEEEILQKGITETPVRDEKLPSPSAGEEGNTKSSDETPAQTDFSGFSPQSPSKTESSLLGECEEGQEDVTDRSLLADPLPYEKAKEETDVSEAQFESIEPEAITSEDQEDLIRKPGIDRKPPVSDDRKTEAPPAEKEELDIKRIIDTLVAAVPEEIVERLSQLLERAEERLFRTVHPLNKELDILVVGIDRRQSEEEENQGADLVMYLSMRPNKERIEIEIIPQRAEGKITPLHRAFGTGGIPALIRETEGYLNVRPDHYVKIDDRAFIEIVEILGGLPLTVAEGEPVVLDGRTALDYAGQLRGDEDERDRIERQIHLLNSLKKEIYSREMLSRVPNIARTLYRGIEGLDTDMSLASMARILLYAARTGPENIYVSMMEEGI